MLYTSTRGQTPALSFSDAVATGLAPDGGLFLPETLPAFDDAQLVRFDALKNDYAALCFEFLRHFATDIPEETLRAIIAKSYTTFSVPEIAPLKQLSPDLFVLELFHGPTLAFKDFALQVLGNLYEHQCRVRGESINVLGATSGDTGSAAIHGLLGKPGTAIFILYPDGRTSPLQERQMACTGAENVFALAIDGTFDDAQNALKDVFGDQDFRTRYHLSAVNSINLARVLAQCVYYLSAWLRLPEGARASAEFVVPTGNFGNVLAGWMLQKMGVPIRGFKVATNQNDILHRLFTTGEYSVADVRPSLAPSMDIQVSSNFERFLYYSLGRDTARVREVMSTFKTTGRYVFENFDRDTFSASRCDDAEIPGIIKRVYQDFGYIVDPHTACAFKDLSRDRASVVLATASPAKFPDTIREAIGMEPTDPALEILKARPLVKHKINADPAAIKAFIMANAV
ncbi:threonine synthase [Ereboglobus sp. PH5-5]|uniref:threonine synthase n=1 Tax=Ereboglobus sp. PH5-5 TaxID=2940529 RepID=UPI0024068237|nr:threonine synthase [Ereboglobus sp. PH5-5]MDF9831806.1 threonine synthase [Ereboglobus sp. PH5-5]